MTYGRVASCAMALMRALRDFCRLPARAAVGICGLNSVEWVLADLACLFGSFISVPLYCRSEDHVFEYIVRQAGLKLIFCDAFHYALFTRLFPDQSQRPILVRFGPSTDQRGPFVAQLVSDHLRELNDDWIETPKSEILTLMYTRYVQIKQINNMFFLKKHHSFIVFLFSGSTGRSKGAIMTEDRWCRFMTMNYRVTFPMRIIAVSQLPHIMERQNVCMVFSFLSFLNRPYELISFFLFSK